MPYRLLRSAALLCRVLPVLLLLRSGAAPAEGAPQFTSRMLADRVLLVQTPDGNVVVGIDGQELVFVDGGRAEYAQALLEFVRRETGLSRVRTLFNSHWHPAQTGLNTLLGAQGTQIIAQENTKQWLASDIWFEGEQLIHQALPAAALPNHTFYADGSMAFAGGRIAYGHLLQAHTDGDLYVHFVDQNVLVTGGAVNSDRWSVIDWWCGGWIGGLLDAYQTLLGMSDDATVIVPATGPTMTRAQLAAQHAVYQEVFARLVQLLKASQDPAETVAAVPTGSHHPDWPERDAFADTAFRSLFAHLRRNQKIGIMP